jgi:exodeoxyribonuclease V alpha subunit
VVAGCVWPKRPPITGRLTPALTRAEAKLCLRSCIRQSAMPACTRISSQACFRSLRGLLNPPDEASIQRLHWAFGAGDKVMQVENDYDKEVYNGDLGFIRSIDAEAGEVLVEFDGRKVAYGIGELDELVLAYATTIHKAQGSEYPAVVIPLTTQHYPMLRRNLVYTGVPRGKRLVVIVGQRKAMGIAVRGGQSLRRWSKLKDFLGTGQPIREVSR